MNEGISLCRADRLLIEFLGIDDASFDARNFSAYQGRLGLEILRAILSPRFDDFAARAHTLEVLCVVLDGYRITAGGVRKSAIEVGFGDLQHPRRSPEQAFGTLKSLDCGVVVAGKKAGLQLSHPVPALGNRERGVPCETSLELDFVELPVIERTECRRLSAQRQDQRELRADDVVNEAVAGTTYELEPRIRLALNVGKCIAGRESIRYKAVAAVACIRNFAALACGVKAATHQILTASKVLRPRLDHLCEDKEHLRLEAIQVGAFNQIMSQLAELEASLDVTEPVLGDNAQPDICTGGALTVALFEAQHDRAADQRRMKILVGKHCGRQGLGQNLQQRKRASIGHRRQLAQLFDPASLHVGQDSVVLASRFLERWMRRPCNPVIPQEIETDRYRKVTAVLCGVNIGTKAGHLRDLLETLSASRKCDEAVSCSTVLPNKELALGSM